LAATAYGIGGISGSLLGGLFTQYLDSRYIFLTYSFFTFFVIVFASNMREIIKKERSNQGLESRLPSTNINSNRLNDSESEEDEVERKSCK
jgi:uncharacterized membrane protein YfcA